MGCTDSKPAPKKSETTPEQAVAHDWTRDLYPPMDEITRKLPFETRKKPNWEEIKAKLPSAKTAEQKEKRKELFRQFDINSNNYLSLAEVDKGIRDVLTCDDIFKAKPAIIRAFNAAKDLAPSYTPVSDDYVTRKEFRVLLVALSRMFDIFIAFEEIDKGCDRRIDEAEFKQAVPLLEQWGATIDDPDATFRTIDKNGGGKILFGEFVDWVQRQGLGDDDDE